jgi:hypothetical protein
MVTHGIGASTFIIVRIMEPFWFMTGIITLLPSLVEREAPQQVTAPISTGVGRGPVGSVAPYARSTARVPRP